jgi:phosphocarrier protein
MKQRSVTVGHQLGLHARVAAKLVWLSGQFSSQITIERTDLGRSADARSIFGLLLLTATHGTELLISADGDDEQPALEAVAGLIEDSSGPKHER